MNHPIQPFEKDKQGTIRFKANPIVRFLLENGPNDMNSLYSKFAMEKAFTKDDMAQFAQLIGYSLGGFSELSYVTDGTYNKAEKQFTKYVRGK